MTLPPVSDPTPFDPAGDPVAEDPGVLDPDGAAEPTGGGDGGGGGDNRNPARDDSPARDPKGGGGNLPGLLRGGQITRVEREGQEDLWFVAYEYPPGSGNQFAFQFESAEQIAAVIGDDWWQNSQMWPIDTRRERWLENRKVNIVDSAAAVIGQTGNFRGLIEDVMRETAQEMGIQDPGLLGQFLSSPEIQLVLATGGMGGWSEERIQAEIRNTDFYTQELYPGIDKFFASGSADPEGDWARFRNNVAASFELLGMDVNDRGLVGEPLASGISDRAFNEFAPSFKRAADSTGYAQALNQWTERRLGQTLDFDQFFDIFEGNAAPEIAQVLEEANLQYAADQRRLDAGGGVIAQIARETDLTEDQIARNFSSAELGVLALGDEGLERAGLNVNQLVRSAFGLEQDAGTAAEVQARVRKFATERGLMDDPKAQLFVGFDERGRPQRPGVQGIRPISG